MLTTLLVDDEEDSRNILRSFLERYCPGVKIVAEAGSVADAITCIEQHCPLLVFLDINMPEENGFALFKRIIAPDFHTIFVTAYDKYAFQAIKHHALDYLLKPVNIQELIQVVNRAQQICAQQDIVRRFDQVLLSMQQRPTVPEKIGLPTSNGFVYVPVAEIIRCEAQGSYTRFYFSDRKPLLISRTLGIYELMLKDKNFVRVHHQHLVNLHHIEQYHRGRGGIIIMSDKKEVIVSQRKKEEFLNAINGNVQENK